MRWVVAIACALCACGRFDFDPFGSGSATGDAMSDAPPTMGPWDQIEIGDSVVCAIKSGSAGDLWCWGYNVFGTTSSTASLWALPTQVPGHWLQVGVAYDHACGIRQDHTLWCWGDNEDGELGDGTTTTHVLPQQVGTANNWLGVKVGILDSCALDMTATLSCWGWNANHQISASAAPSLPTPTVLDSSISDFSIAEYRTCAIRTDGTLWCIGKDEYGDLGTGNASTDLLVWTQIGTGTTWNRISLGPYHTCAVQKDNTLWCWGYGSDGRNGVGDDVEHDAPMQVAQGSQWTSVLAGRSHTCAYALDNTLSCFGTGGHGELGAEVGHVKVPTAIGATAVHTYAVGDELTCYVDMAGILRCGGQADVGQFAAGGSPTHPVQADARTDWASLAMYMDTSCGIDMAGNGWCWGRGDDGQVGDGATSDRQQPVMLPGTGWTSLASSVQFSTGVRAGSLYEWGKNYATGTYHTSPSSISAALGWTFVAAGGDHACGIIAGTAYCWGDQPNVGYASPGNVAMPTTALPGTLVTIGAGDAHSCGDESGTLECWGTNVSGQLANGSTNPSVTPVNATCTGSGCASTLLKIVGGSDFACALYSDGHLSCWGNGTYGQLGNGNYTSPTTVTVATTYTDWTDIAAGDIHACGIRANGTLWCWGHGDGGQLGNDMVPNRSPTPSQVGTDTNWLSVAAGDHNVCALKTDHTRWCWGNDGKGGLGDGKAWTPGFVIVANSI